jgi:hypothetical protein
MKKIIKYIGKVLCWPFKKIGDWLKSGLPPKEKKMTERFVKNVIKCATVKMQKVGNALIAIVKVVVVKMQLMKIIMA